MSRALLRRSATRNTSATPGPLQSGSALRTLLLYFKYVSLTLFFVGIAATVQIFYILGDYQGRYIIIPILVALTVGLLLGRVAQLQGRLRQQNQQFQAVADLAQEFTYFQRSDGRFDYVSPACADLTGYTQTDFYHTPQLLDQLIHPEDKELWQQHQDHLKASGRPVKLDLRLQTRDGHTVWVQHVSDPVFDSRSKRIGTRATNLDITQRKAFEARIERMAYYDPLTNLHNRYALSQDIEQLIGSSEQAGRHFAVMFLDLDRFKHVNDSFGHGFGDRLLSQLAKRLTACCGQYGAAFVSRFGGDEFVVVIPYETHPDEVRPFAQQILDAVEQPFVLEEVELYLTGNIGVALYPFDGNDANTLIRNADAAMYKSKREFHGNVSFYSAELVDSATTFISTESKMRKALKEDRFIMYYQPQISLTDGTIIGLEALVRWQHDDSRLILPHEFIAIAEETGLIKPLGALILEKVCGDLAGWQQQGMAVPIAVNISGRQLTDPNFVEQVQHIIQTSGCDASLLEMEVTEQVFLVGLGEIEKKLQRLRDLGISIALDDFGTGYSSLSYLRRLPIDTLKIDGSFIRDTPQQDRDLAILRSILSLCRDLGLTSVAEGVETFEQKELLERLGAEVGQGFYFFQPIPVGEVSRLLRGN